jgi:hypothetical protein
MVPLPFLSPIFDLVSKVVDRLVPDKAAAEKAKLEMAAVLQSQEYQVQIEQIKVNAAEGASTNWLVAGARPFIMWTCGFALMYASILEPIFRFLAQVLFGYSGAFPVIDTNLTMQVLFGILGLGAFRTVEKVKGAEGNR